MEELRLPWTAREGIIYGCIIAGLSSLIIGGYNVYDNLGYSLETFDDFLADYLVVWPAIFLIAFLLAKTLVGKIAKIVIGKFISPGDSVNAYICFNIIVCVLLMSVILTFLGGFIGQSIAMLMGGNAVDVMGLIENWPEIWPRNFCIAFWVEMLIAQPIARMAMVRIHTIRMGDAAASDR